MADTPSNPAPAANESLIVRQLSQLWTLVILSLIINAVLLTLIVIGAVIHHHQMREGMNGPGGPGWGPPPGRGQMAWRDRGGMRSRDFRGGFRDRFGGGRDFDRNPGPGGPMGVMGGNPPDPAQMSQMVMEHLSRALSLTDEEKAKIKPIVDQQVAEFQKQREVQRAAIQKQFEDTKSKIKPLLTPDQQKQLDALPLPGPK